MSTFWCYFSGLGKKMENGAPQGGWGGHAIRSCLCMFRDVRPLLPWLHFWFHFGVILGAKFATILFFGHPSRQQSPEKVVVFQCFFFLVLRGLRKFAPGVCVCVCVWSLPPPWEERRRGKKRFSDAWWPLKGSADCASHGTCVNPERFDIESSR